VWECSFFCLIVEHIGVFASLTVRVAPVLQIDHLHSACGGLILFRSFAYKSKLSARIHSIKKALPFGSACDLLDRGAYRSRTDDFLTARDNTGYSTGLHYTLIHYITIIIYSCFSYILHLFSVLLAKKLAKFQIWSFHKSIRLFVIPLHSSFFVF
jgi:hypothetical protein